MKTKKKKGAEGSCKNKENIKENVDRREWRIPEWSSSNIKKDFCNNARFSSTVNKLEKMAKAKRREQRRRRRDNEDEDDEISFDEDEDDDIED